MFSKAPENGRDKRLLRYDHIIVHCTATPPNIDADAAWVDRAHRERGFKNGCGYHAVITRKGDWQDHDGGFTTREPGFMGAHVGDCGRGWNERSFGVSLAGGVRQDMKPEMNFTESQMDTLEAGLMRFLELHPKPNTVRIIGHRDLIALTHAPPKACPCFDVTAWWSDRQHRPRNAAAGKPPMGVFGAILRGEDTRADKNHTLVVPDVYVAIPGDTLSKIASTHGLTVARLKEINNKTGDMLKAGEKLKLR